MERLERTRERYREDTSERFVERLQSVREFDLGARRRVRGLRETTRDGRNDGEVIRVGESERGEGENQRHVFRGSDELDGEQSGFTRRDESAEVESHQRGRVERRAGRARRVGQD